MPFFHLLLKRCKGGGQCAWKSFPTLKELITIKMEELLSLKSWLRGAVVINTSSFLSGGFGLGIYLCIFKTKYYKMPHQARVGRLSWEKGVEWRRTEWQRGTSAVRSRRWAWAGVVTLKWSEVGGNRSSPPTVLGDSHGRCPSTRTNELFTHTHTHTHTILHHR